MRQSLRIVRISTLCSALTALAGCVAYEPAPIDLARSAAALGTPIAVISPGEPIPYPDALDLTLARSPTVLQARAAYQSALAVARSARVRPAMTLALTAEYSRQSDPTKPWLFGGALDVPLDRTRDTRMTTADMAVIRARFDLIEAVWATRTALRRALVEESIARDEIAVADRLIAVRETRRALLERRVALGEDARPGALAAAGDLALARQRRISADAALRAARAALAAQLGVAIEVVDPLTVAAPVQVEPDAADIPEHRKNAATGRADVLKAVIDYDIAEQAVRTAVAGQYPQVTLSPGYTWERGITKLPFNLGLALPPVDLNRAAIHEAEVKRIEAGVALEAAQARVFAEVDAASSALADADRKARSIEDEDRPRARRIRTLMVRSTARGETDRTDVLGAEASELDVDLAAIDMRRLRATALLGLEAATRVLADPVERDHLAAAIPPVGTRP